MLVLTAIILIVASLRRFGMFGSDSGTLFASLIRQLTLPALIFYALSHAALEWKYLLVTGLMLAGELLLSVLLLKLDAPPPPYRFSGPLYGT